MHTILRLLNRLLEKTLGKRLVYYTPNQHNELGKTAAWCSRGFWYVGNVYDTADIAYGIAQHGIVEATEMAVVETVLSALSQHNQTLHVYDIGCNTGIYSLLAAAKFHATVDAFDPVAQHTTCVRASAALNSLTTITTHTLALGAATGSGSLRLAGSGSSLVPGFNGTKKYDEIVVTIAALDQLNLPPPHFIKIDVEGYEYDVLMGADKTISAARPVCFIEIAERIDARLFVNKRFTQIVAYFTDRSYRLFRLDGSCVTPLAKAPSVDGVRMYLCIPQETSIAPYHERAQGGRVE